MSTTPKTAVERMARQRFPSDRQVSELQRGQGAAWRVDPPAPSLSDEPVRRLAPAHGRRFVVLSAGVAAIALAIAIVLVPRLGTSPATAATPPSLQYTPTSMEGSPAKMLAELAKRAQRQPTPPGTGPYHYVHTREFHLSTDMTTDMVITDARVEEESREVWLADDGSGRIEVIRSGGLRAPWSGTRGPREDTVPRLEGAEDSMRAELRRQGRGRTSGDWFDAAAQLWKQQVVTPQLQSALLTVLAEQPGLTVEGTTTDRGGREGIAISTDIERTNPIVPEMRYVLVFDADTGMLLDYEQIALQAGDLPIQAPATIGYTLWMGSGYSPDTTTHP